MCQSTIGLSIVKNAPLWYLGLIVGKTAYVGAGSMSELSAISTQFYCDLKTAHYNKVYYFFKNLLGQS